MNKLELQSLEKLANRQKTFNFDVFLCEKTKKIKTKILAK